MPSKLKAACRFRVSQKEWSIYSNWDWCKKLFLTFPSNSIHSISCVRRFTSGSKHEREIAWLESWDPCFALGRAMQAKSLLDLERTGPVPSPAKVLWFKKMSLLDWNGSVVQHIGSSYTSFFRCLSPKPKISLWTAVSLFFYVCKRSRTYSLISP